MVLCIAMVAKVSPNCVKVEPKRLSSSMLNLHAIAFASTVMDAVNSHEFLKSPLMLYYARKQQLEKNLIKCNQFLFCI